MLNTEFVKIVKAVAIKVRDEKFIIDVKHVKEIYIPGEQIVPVPLAAKSIVGIIDIRGNIYSIISLEHNIYRDVSEYDLNHHTRLLLLEYSDFNIALLVDSVLGVIDLPISVLESQPAIIKTNIDFGLMKSIGIYNKESYIMLDLDALIQPYITDLKERAGEISDHIPKVISRPKHFQKVGAKTKEMSTYTISQEKISPSTQTMTVNEQKLVLTKEQKDMLQEIGNIGCGNAVTALSKLIKKKIDINLTDVGIVSFDEISKQFGKSNKKICGIFCHINKPSESTILQVFEMNPLMKLIASLTGKKSKINPSKVKSKKDLDDFAISTISEMGNIMAGHYISAISDLTQIRMMMDVPEFTMSTTNLLGDFLAKEFESISKYIIIIRTSINIADLKLSGMSLFIPDLKMLEAFFDKLGFNQKTIEHKTEIYNPSKKIQPSEFKLTDMQRDALKEVGNIGAGNAANALAQMINKRVDINIPSVEMVELEEYARSINDKNEKLLVAWSNVIGKTRATVLSIFNVTDIINLTSIIVDDKNKKGIDLRKKIEKTSDIPELYKSAIYELGHILASHYISAIGDLIGFRLMTEPPDISVDTGKQLFTILEEEIGLLKKFSLIITTNVIITDFKITGSFLYIPNLETLQELLDALLSFYE
ncbi:MAG: chemotaxis protein CheC [Candidatus Heimdallarchaeota archaeon]